MMIMMMVYYLMTPIVMMLILQDSLILIRETNQDSVTKEAQRSDSIKSVEDARSKTVPFVPSSNLDRTLLVSSNRNNGVPATSGRDNNAVHGIPLTQTKSNTRIERTTERNQNGLHPVREQSASGSTAKPILPSVSRKSNVEVLKSSRQQQQPQLQQQIASFARPVVPQSQLKHEIPSSSVVSRNISVRPQGLNAGRQQQGPSALKPGIPGPVLNHLSPITTGKRPISEITNPSSSGPAKLEKKKELKKAGPTRAEKKMMKKHAKYEKLIGSWVPPVFKPYYLKLVVKMRTGFLEGRNLRIHRSPGVK
ncbi:hypothetical protein HanRHA438_Chr13g0577521 [Helianthus annuus]|nr:hypothetical protein HanRHA438_Chr13g0577521 [Helianthus annuus]